MFGGGEFQEERTARTQEVSQEYAWHIREAGTLLVQDQSKQGVEEIREETKGQISYPIVRTLS